MDLTVDGWSTENVANHLEPKRTIVNSATGDSMDCTHCEKRTPRLTLSFHEAVCKSQSLEAKARFIRRTSAVSNSIQLSAAEMRQLIHTSNFYRI